MNANTLKKMELKQLVEIWEMVSLKKTTPEIAIVRGWILEALEEKAPAGMDAYYDGFYEDEELRRFVLA